MNFTKKICIPGQAALLQFSDFSSVDPSELQLCPPYCREGLLHIRSFVRVPPPQVTEQAPQSPQSPHLPLTTIVQHEK